MRRVLLARADVLCKRYKVVVCCPAKQPNNPEFEIYYMLLICEVSIV